MRKLFSLMAIGLALAVVGCENESPASKSTSSTTTGSTATSTSGGGLKIVFIPKQSGSPYFDDLSKGFQDAATEMKADYNQVAPSTADATSQIPIIKDQIQRGVDVIVVSANAPDTLNQVLDQAKAKGITVMTVDSDITGNESHRDAAVMSPPTAEVGSSQVELLGSLINYEGPIGIVSATPDAPNQNAWIAAMKDTLKQPKYAKMKLVDTVYGNDEVAKSATVSEGLLSQHPDLKGIIAPTTAGFNGAAQTLKVQGDYPGGAHANGKGVTLIGLASPRDGKGFIMDGVVPACQLWSPHDMGYVAAYVGAAIHSGKVKPAEGASVDVGKLGNRKFEKLNVVRSGSMVTYNKANVGQ